MAFRSISVNQTAATTLVVTPPAGIQDGDILVAFSVSDNAANTTTFPAGFTAVTGSPITLSSLDACRIACAIKIASSESGNYSLTSGTTILGGVAAFSGRNPSVTPHQISNNKSDTGNASPWSITSAAYGSNTTLECDIAFVATSDGLGADAVHAAPAGYTLDSDFTGGGANAIQGMFAHKDAVALGSSGVLTGTGTLAAAAAAWAVFSIALAIGVTAAITGTATASITEADVVTGGKTIVITLTGAQWIPA